MQRLLCPLFDIYKGEGGEVGYTHRYRGGGIGGIYGGCITKTPPVNYRRGGYKFDITKYI
jgi:hypothetical protein